MICADITIFSVMRKLQNLGGQYMIYQIAELSTCKWSTLFASLQVPKIVGAYLATLLSLTLLSVSDRMLVLCKDLAPVT